jgi:ribonuclease H2 subunit B
MCALVPYQAHAQLTSLSVGRTKAACDLLSQYLPQPVHALLLASYEYVLVHFPDLHSRLCLLSFTALEAHLQALRDADAAAILANTSNAAPSRKKGAPLGRKSSSKMAVDDDDEGKNKKRKAGESVGVAKLKKANISGMKTIGSFFGAAPKK